MTKHEFITLAIFMCYLWLEMSISGPCFPSSAKWAGTSMCPLVGRTGVTTHQSISHSTWVQETVAAPITIAHPSKMHTWHVSTSLQSGASHNGWATVYSAVAVCILLSILPLCLGEGLARGRLGRTRGSGARKGVRDTFQQPSVWPWMSLLSLLSLSLCLQRACRPSINIGSHLFPSYAQGFAEWFAKEYGLQ